MLFGRALQGSAFFRRSGLRAAAPAAVSALVSVFGDTTCSALISGFLCLLLHLYCSQRSTASHFVTHTRHKVLERVRCVRLSCLAAAASGVSPPGSPVPPGGKRPARATAVPRPACDLHRVSRRTRAQSSDVRPPRTAPHRTRDEARRRVPDENAHDMIPRRCTVATVGLQHGHGSGRVQPARGRVGWYTPLPAPLDCTPLHGSSRRETRPTASWTRRRLSPV